MVAAASLRAEPSWYTPAGLPPELVAFEQPVRDSLAVGAPGKVGLLELTLAPSNGTTRVERLYQRAPLYVYRPVYLDPGRRDMAFIYLLQAGDGFVQGDRSRIDVCCRPGATAHVTTQAASKVFGAHQNFVTQMVNLTVGAGAILEYLPDPVVPFARSRFFQRTELVLGQGSTAILAETLLPGRVAHGEAHAFDVFWSETEASSADGRLLFVDVLRLNPAGGDDPRSVVLLGANDVVATLYVLTDRLEPSAVVELLRSACRAHPAVVAGASELPNRSGSALRLLGPTTRAVHDALRAAWSTVRLALVGAPAPDLRKG
jgi:urease accessory protein